MRTGAAGLVLGVVGAGMIGALPVTEHLADADVACGSVWRHATTTDATPVTVATGSPAIAGTPGTHRFDACPASTYRAREIEAAVGGIAVAITIIGLARRHRPAGPAVPVPAAGLS